MTDLISANLEKKCPRCGAVSSCRQEAGCWCASVRVEPAMLAELRARYADCVCEACLRELAAGKK